MSASDHALSVLRANDPALRLAALSRDAREVLRDRVLASSAYAAPAAPRVRARRSRTIQLAGILVGMLVIGVGAAWASGALSPLAVFENSPQQQDAAPGSLWDQRVLAASVVEVTSVAVPKIGSIGFWFGRTKQDGWCGALRLPSGEWLGTGSDPRDAGGTTPGCWPARGTINNASPTPVYVTNGFDYQEDSVDARGEGGSFWRIRYGAAPEAAVKVVDVVSGASAPVNAEHLFALAILDPDPNSATNIHLVAYDAAGNVVADDAP